MPSVLALELNGGVGGALRHECVRAGRGFQLLDLRGEIALQIVEFFFVLFREDALLVGAVEESAHGEPDRDEQDKDELGTLHDALV